MRAPVFLLLALVCLGAPFARAEEQEQLALEARVPEGPVTSGEPFAVEVVFANRGAHELQILLPLHRGSVPFPVLVLRHEDGRAYTPVGTPFQSMWKDGLQGEILALAPGATETFTTRVDRVVPYVDQDRPVAWSKETPELLPPGRYAVHALHVKADDSVAWSAEAFKTETRRHEGLWTGRARSAEVALVVQPSTRPILELEAPETATPGAPYVARIVLGNQGDETLTTDLALVLQVAKKAYGSGSVRWVLNDTNDRRAASDDETWRLELGPRGTRVLALDLAALSFAEDRPRAGREVGLFDLVGSDGFHVGVRLVGRGQEVLADAGAFRRVQGPVAEARIQDLVLRLEDAGHRGNTPRVRVVLENAGEASVRVPASLAWPGHVFFSLAREGGQRRHAVTYGAREGGLLGMPADEPTDHALLPEPLAWDGDRYEETPALSEAALVTLTPGAALERTFVLGDLLAQAGALDHGGAPVQVRAFWRNLDDGRRLGLEPVLVTGLLQSETLKVTGRGW